MVGALYYIFIIPFISLCFIIMFEKIKETIERLEKEYDFNDLIMNYLNEIDLKDCKDADWLRDLLEKANEECGLTDAEIIYYASAMDFLRENDPSLRDSLELARDMGYTIDNINSELLASILKSDMNKDDYIKFIDQVVEEIGNEMMSINM